MIAQWVVEHNTYKWAMDAISYGGNDYLPVIDPDSWKGMTCAVDITSQRLIKPNKAQFDVINPSGAIICYSTDEQIGVVGETFMFRLLKDGTLRRTWEMVCTRATESYGKIRIYCEDFTAKPLLRKYPNTKNPKVLWPSNDKDIANKTVVPIILGTAFIPVLPVVVDNQLVYVMGEYDAGRAYTVSEIRTPHDYASKSSWDASFYYTQTNAEGVQLVAPLVADGNQILTVPAEDADTGIWAPGSYVLSPLLKYSHTDTVALTGPEEWLEYVLEGIGIASGDIDTGEGSSFETAGALYADRGIEFNGGFWVAETGEAIVKSLLHQTDSFLYIGENVDLYPFSATSIETFTKDDTVLKSFTINPRTIVDFDGGNVEWVEAGEPQDVFSGKAEVKNYNSQTSVEQPSEETLICRFISDSQVAQIAGTLFHAKRNLVRDDVSFEVPMANITNLATLRPAQVLTLSDVIFGAEYKIVITELQFNKTSVGFSGVRLEYLEDWDNIESDAISIANYIDDGFSVANGADGISAYFVALESSNGLAFKISEARATTITARVFYERSEITSTLESSAFAWRRVSKYDTSGDAAWNATHSAGYKTIDVTVDDIDLLATFFCDVNIT